MFANHFFVKSVVRVGTRRVAQWGFSMSRSSRSRIFQCIVAVFSVIVALVVTMLMVGIDQKPVLFVFLGAVMISAAVGGMLPGLLALALSGALSAYFVLKPIHSFAMEGVGSFIRWVAFQLIGLLIITLHASRRAVAERLSQIDQRLRLAMDAGHIGVWDYSIDTGELWLSLSLTNLLGQSKWFRPTFNEFIDLIHSDDRELFHQTVLRTITDRVDYEVDFRIIRPDGSTRRLVSRGRGYAAAGSGGRRIVGVITENTTHEFEPFAPAASKSNLPAGEKAVSSSV